MGILKFTLPLAFPLAFKYVFDVLLVPQPHAEHLNSMIDRWCIAIAATLHLGVGSAAKLVSSDGRNVRATRLKNCALVFWRPRDC